MYEQERPFDYPGSTSEPHYEVYKFIFANVVQDDSGESYDRYTLLRFSRLADDVEIAEVIRDQFPSTRCQHEHDCCGNFYAGTATWDRVDRIDKWSDPEAEYNQPVLVKQGFSANI